MALLETSGTPVALAKGSQSHVILGASAQGDIVSYKLQAGGGAVAQGYIYTMTGEGRLQGVGDVFNGYQVITTHTDSPESYATDPVTLEVIRIGVTECLVSLCQSDVEVSTFPVALQVAAGAWLSLSASQASQGS